MADDPNKEIGFYKIEEALVRRWDTSKNAFVGSFNIAQYISSLTFVETMDSPYFEGAAYIMDSSDMINKLPLKGEELFTVTYRDFFNTKITQDYLIHSVEMNNPGKQQNNQTYVIRFASPQLMLSDSIIIKKAYSGTIKKMIEDVFNETLQSSPLLQNTKLPLEIEDTVGDNQRIIIPAKSPLEAIDMLRKKAYSTTNKSSNYYFFQTRKKYIMATHEKLIEDGKKVKDFDKNKIYTHDPGLHTDLSQIQRAMNNLIDISWPERKNTSEELLMGAVRQEIVEINYLEKEYKKIKYNYVDNHRDYKHLDMDKTLDKYNNWHTSSFLNLIYPAEKTPVYSTLLFHDVERKEAHYLDIIGPRHSTSYYLSNIMCDIEIYGRNDLNVGDVIKLNIPQYETVEGTKPLNYTLSGYWLVREIKHVMEGKAYKMFCKITKDLPGLGGGSGGTKQDKPATGNTPDPAKKPDTPSGATKTGPGYTSPGGSDPRGMEPTIRAAAEKYGVDPDVAMSVARSEGLSQFYGDGGQSGGAFQLYTGTVGGGGLGTDFQRQTGLNPLDPANEAATIDFAMKYVSENGWGKWNGAKRIGVYGFTGVTGR